VLAGDHVAVTYIARGHPYLHAVPRIPLLLSTNYPASEFASALSILVALLLMVLPAVYLISELARQVSEPIPSPCRTFAGRGLPQWPDRQSHRLSGNAQLGVGRDSQINRRLCPDILDRSVSCYRSVHHVLRDVLRIPEGEAFIARIRQLLPLEASLKERCFMKCERSRRPSPTDKDDGSDPGHARWTGVVGVWCVDWLFWGAIMIIMVLLPVLGTPIVWFLLPSV
jgi:hypothetical protein